MSNLLPIVWSVDRIVKGMVYVVNGDDGLYKIVK